MRRVAFTRRAEADFEEIADDIAAENPRRAVTVVRDLRRRCEALDRQPRAHRLREEFGPGVRVLVHRGWLILYSLRDDGRVVIQRIIHGARDIDRLAED